MRSLGLASRRFTAPSASSRMRRCSSDAVERPDHTSRDVVDADAADQVLVIDGAAGDFLEGRFDAFVFLSQVGGAQRAVQILGEVDVLNSKVRQVSLDDAGQVPGRIADRVEDHSVEQVQSAGQPQLKGALHDGANERLKARVSVGDLDLVAPADDAHRQHARSVDQLYRRVHREAADSLPSRISCLPFLDRSEAWVVEYLARLRDYFFDGEIPDTHSFHLYPSSPYVQFSPYEQASM